MDKFPEMQTYESSVDKFIAIAKQYLGRPINTVFELGARDCRETLRFENVLPEAQIYTFECNPDTLPLCRANIAGHRNIHLIEKAVANFEGETEFHQIDPQKTVTSWQDGNPGASSLLQATGKYPLEQYAQRPVPVQVTTLASEMKNFNIDHIDLLWIDIQGAELMALEGLDHRIRDISLIHVEVSFFEIYQNQPFFMEVKKYLNEKGFLLAGFTAFGEYSGDAIFVNRQILANPLQSITATITDKTEYRFRATKQQTLAYRSKLIQSCRWFFRLGKTALFLAKGDCRTWKLKVGKVFDRMSFRNSPISSSVTLDVLIVAAPKDYPTLPLVIQSLREHVKHPIEQIIIIAPDSTEVRSIAETSGCTFLDESRQLPLSRTDIIYSSHGIDRSGWLFQQLLKLAGDQICTNEYFLVIDADTVLVRPHVFVKDEKTLLLYSDEYHNPYFSTYKKLLGTEPTSCVSFISHYMLFHKPKLKALKLAIEQYTGMTWYQAIVENTDRTDPSGFSEYETYGNFISIQYRDLLWTEYSYNLGLKAENRDLEEQRAHLPRHYRSISFHSYRAVP
jgi:FkbM family methyltransferase